MTRKKCGKSLHPVERWRNRVHGSSVERRISQRFPYPHDCSQLFKKIWDRFADTAHQTPIFWSWRSCSWIVLGLSTDQYLVTTKRGRSSRHLFIYTLVVGGYRRAGFSWKTWRKIFGLKFGKLTLLSCMTICCNVHKSALTYKEIIFCTSYNQ
jgi:hypothetical protein